MPTSLVATQDAAVQQLDAMWDFLVSREEEWFGRDREYGQCRHSQNIPHTKRKDKNPKKAIQIIDIQPSDRPGMTAREIFGVNFVALLNFAFEVHAYRGPLGRGFVYVQWIMYDDALYRRAVNHGPEPELSHDWQEDIPEPPDLENSLVQRAIAETRYLWRRLTGRGSPPW